MPGTSTEQVVDKGIRQKSTKEWTHSLTAVPFVRGHRNSEKHRRVYTSSNVCHSHEWRVDAASGKTLKKRNACLHAVRQEVGKRNSCIYGLRSEGVKRIDRKTEIQCTFMHSPTVIMESDSTHVDTKEKCQQNIQTLQNWQLKGTWKHVLWSHAVMFSSLKKSHYCKWMRLLHVCAVIYMNYVHIGFSCMYFIWDWSNCHFVAAIST